jgi:hypothetical protein
MLDRFVNQGRIDAMARFKVSMSLGPAGAPGVELGGAGAGVPHPAAGGGFMDKAKAFGHGQLGAAKDLFGNMRQGLGGAATPELGSAARGAALGNLKTLAPSLLAGGGLYMLHKHKQKEQEQQARQQAMMMQGGY